MATYFEYALIAVAPLMTIILLCVRVRPRRIIFANVLLMLLCVAALHVHGMMRLAEDCMARNSVRRPLYEQIYRLFETSDMDLIKSYFGELSWQYAVSGANLSDESLNEFYEFLDVWDCIIKGDKNISFPQFDIVFNNTHHASLVDKSGNVILEKSPIYLWGKYPYVYGTSQETKSKYNRYKFVLDLRDMNFVSEEQMGEAEFAKFYEKLKRENYVTKDPIPFCKLKGSFNRDNFDALKTALKSPKN